MAHDSNTMTLATEPMPNRIARFERTRRQRGHSVMSPLRVIFETIVDLDAKGVNQVARADGPGQGR